MYVWSDGCNHFNAYHFNGTTFDTPPVSQSTILSQCGSSGGVLTLSANGSTPGSGVVWSSMPISGDGNSGVHPGMLRAFDADDLSTELWNSEQNPARDDAGNWPKFSPPTVVNGRVYLASFPIDGVGDTVVNVYGLLGRRRISRCRRRRRIPASNPGGSVDLHDRPHGDAMASPTPVHLDVERLAARRRPRRSRTNDLAPPAETTLTVRRRSVVAARRISVRRSTRRGGTLAAQIARRLLRHRRSAPARAPISIDFVGGGAPLAPTGVAGVVAKPNWNEATSASGSGSSRCSTRSAADTGATLTWTRGGVGALGLADGSPDFAMMNGYLDAESDTATTVTVANLPAYAGRLLRLRLRRRQTTRDERRPATSRSTRRRRRGAAFGAHRRSAGRDVQRNVRVRRRQRRSGNYAVLLVGGTRLHADGDTVAIGGGPTRAAQRHPDRARRPHLRERLRLS